MSIKKISILRDLLSTIKNGEVTLSTEIISGDREVRVGGRLIGWTSRVKEGRRTVGVSFILGGDAVVQALRVEDGLRMAPYFERTASQKVSAREGALAYLAACQLTEELEAILEALEAERAETVAAAEARIVEALEADAAA